MVTKKKKVKHKRLEKHETEVSRNLSLYSGHTWTYSDVKCLETWEVKMFSFLGTGHNEYLGIQEGRGFSKGFQDD